VECSDLGLTQFHNALLSVCQRPLTKRLNWVSYA
jgi:hypothetical protein